jgi:hypothetical protein
MSGPDHQPGPDVDPPPEIPADLLEELLRPLGDDQELPLLLRADLLDGIAHAKPQPADDTPQQAAQRLRDLPAGARKSRCWGEVSASAAAAASIAAAVLWLAAVAVDLPEISMPEWWSYSRPDFFDRIEKRHLATLHPRGPVFTWEWWTDPKRHSEDMWRARPDEPALYFIYCRCYNPRAGELPADYDATWRRFDPDNGIWLLLQADRLTRKATTRDPKGTAKRIISNPALFRQALDCVDQALLLPRLETFSQHMHAAVRESSPLAQTYGDATAIRAESDLFEGSSHLLPGNDVMRLEFDRLLAAHDAPALKSFLPKFRRLLARQMLAEPSTGPADIARKMVFDMSKICIPCDDAGLQGMLHPFTPADAAGWETPPPEGAAAPAAHTPAAQALAALVWRLSCLTAAGMLLLAVAVGWLRQIPLRGAAAGRLVDCFAPLLDRSSRRIAMLRGVWLPAGVFVGAFCVTPARGLMDPENFLTAAICVSFGLIFNLSRTVQKQLSRRGAFLGLRPNAGLDRVEEIFRWLLLLSPLPMLVNIGGVNLVPFTSLGCGLAFVWLFVRMLAGGDLPVPGSEPAPKPRLLLLAREMIPPLLTLAFALIAAAPVLGWLERKIVTEHPDLLAPEPPAKWNAAMEAKLRRLGWEP